ncbi:glycosyltransferase [Hallella absiana]|uniref:glycosyltransferase n=1 Tax=Hallella absiana TaxID=2925336 RepID=UPI0021C63AF9|nr:glycosyltransferase [Hallella absiana]
MKDKNLKVLHICTSDSGGAGLCCLRIHKALLEQGIDSKVLTLNKTSSNVPEVYQYGRFRKYGTWKGLIIKATNKIIRSCGLRLTDYNKAMSIMKRTNVTTSLPFSCYDVAKHPLVKEADVIHLHWISNFLDYPSFFNKVRKPIVWTLHDENLFYGIFHYNPGKYKDLALEKKYYTKKESAIKSTSKLGVVFLSKMMHEKFAEHEILKSRACTIINNPVDCNQYRPIEKAKARRELGIPLDKIIFSFVAGGIADPRKGLKILSNTLQRMRISNAYILAVGGEDDYEPLPNVHAIGEIKDSVRMSAAYSCSDYFVMPSKQEAFAQTPMEAMACGIPAIVFPVSGTEELITPQNGVRAKGFTSQDLEEAIRQAMATHYDGDIIRQDMINRFSPEIIANKYIEFYKRMLCSIINR